MDRFPAGASNRTLRPWRVATILMFERRITRIDGTRITVDVPLTNALEKEHTRALVRRLELPERISEVGIEDLAGRSEYTDNDASQYGSVFIRVDAVANGWVRNVLGDHFVESVVRLGDLAKWITVMDSVGINQSAREGTVLFTIGGQQSLVLRCRSLGSNLRAVMTTGGVPGPNAVVDFLAVGRGVEVAAQRRWATGLLLDNVQIVDGAREPSGAFSLENLGAKATGHGWAAANSVLWNCRAREMSVDSPPTAQNWVLGGGAAFTYGTGHYAELGSSAPASLYRAQLAERLGDPAATAALK
jgi:hypothetical protein